MKNSIDEEKKLKSVIALICENLKTEKIELQDLYKNFIGDREKLWKEAERKKIHISNLEYSKDNPYFARIDFISDDDRKSNVIYIGKNGVRNDSEIVVTDWRAPISSLYYDADLGRCTYESPGGPITGELTLKRQYEIELGKLIDYFDVDLVSSDSLLQKYLNSNNDARLKSIVATIQKEQNDVIRRKMFENLIIQGVAGSGKTTVALHRIAYLVYNYMKYIKQNQYLVIGPNPVFLKYIKSVLPELDASEVDQCTFEVLSQDYINENIKINSSEKKAIKNINEPNINCIDKFKSSMKYKNMIELFMNVYFAGLTSSDLMLGDFKILDKAVMKSFFDTSATNYNRDLKSRVEMTIERVCRHIEDNLLFIQSRYTDYSAELFKTATTNEEKNKLRTLFSKQRTEISKYCKGTVRKYFSKANVNVTKLYKIFIQSISDFNVFNYESINDLKKNTLFNIKQSTYDFEDLSALMYIKFLVAPNKKFNNIRHVVVDEAQDLGEFNFWILKNCLPNATFSIFGDLAQSIYDYRGIDNWQDVNNIMFGGQGNIVHFNKSYRTTAEIMDVADEVSDFIGLGRSDLVVRHGNQVEMKKFDVQEDIPTHIASKIQEYLEKGYKTIAVISKTDLLSRYINDDLKDRGIDIPNVTVNDDLSDDKFKVCTISNQLSKGLEFDAVILNNASEQIYSSQNNLDMKLLYVAITRALHEIDIVYSGELSKPLENHKKKTYSRR